MEIIKTNVKIRLTCEEEDAFVKVLEVLEKVAEDKDANNFCLEATDRLPANSLLNILNDFFQACD